MESEAVEVEFKEFGKIPRLNRGCTVTEKIDGTNACIIVTESGLVYAQSRNRLITPANDNAGFAKWVVSHYREIREVLGEGYHYGEWWGSGIQRGYGLTGGEKRFSLFNSFRWKDTDFSSVPGLGVVPILYEGPFDQARVNSEVTLLKATGSKAAPGFMRPEGVIVYHEAAKQYFKVTVDNDEKPKGSTE